MNLPELSIRRPVTATMLMLILMVLGVVSFTRLGLDFFPDLQYPEVAIITTYPGASSEEVETLITRPLEDSAATVSGVRKVKSSSREGVSVVQVELGWGSNLDLVAQDVRNMMDITYDLLPDEVERPLVLKSNMDLMPVLYYGVYSTTGRDLRNLRTLIEDNVEKRLAAVTGVAAVTLSGGLEREILVEVDRKRLEAHGLSLDDIISVIRMQNRDIPGGHIIRGTREFVLRTIGRFGKPSDIADTIVAVRDGRPVYIRDVARVEDSHKEVRNITKTNYRDSIVLWVTKESGANTVRVVDAVRAEIALIVASLPPDIRFADVWDTSKIVRDSVSQLGTTVRWGGLITLVVLYLFLLSVRTTLTLLISIPFAIITTFVAMYFSGYTLNLVTLSGLALGVGMIVDNSVVVLENIYRHVENGEPPLEAARKGASEVSMAITASTLTSVIVFVPLVFAGGLAGEFTKPLGLTVTFALLASLLIALTIIPMIASRILRPSVSRRERTFYSRLTGRYSALVGFSLRRRGLMVLGAFTLLIVSIVVMGMVKQEYMPALDEIYTTCVIKMEPGSSLAETYKFVEKIELEFMSRPEYRSLISLTGLSDSSKYDLASGAGPAGVNEAQIFYEISPKGERSITSSQFNQSVIAKLPPLAEGTSYFMQTTDYFTRGGDRPIEVKLVGSDLDVLYRESRKLEAFFEESDGIVNPDRSLRLGKPELQIDVDREKAAHMGITAGQVADTVDAAFLGRTVTTYREAGEEYDIRVRFSEQDRQTFRNLEDITIASPMGFQVHLSDIARIHEGMGPIEIKREDQARIAAVSASYDAHIIDLAGVRKKITAYFEKNPLPEGYSFRFAGSIADMGEMATTMLWVMVLIILLVYMVMAAQFESLSHPLAIMAAVPLAFIGVAVGLLITGNSLSVMSYIGIMMLIGIVVNNGIVLIDYVNQLRAQGMEKKQAIMTAGASRLRPILMTTMTTCLAIIPMAISRGEGAELFAPIAVTIFGGLLSSMFLTLLIVPALYSLIDGAAARMKSMLRRV
jgi:hydrophobic/amphiphilic exporter-1 (mainly G- bacteria), HAE1 family